MAASLSACMLLAGQSRAQSMSQPEAAAEAQMRAGDFAGAAQSWRALIAAHPQDAVFHAELGSCLAAQGDDSGAAAEYRRSLALQPHQPSVSMALGIAEFKQGHFAQAIAPLRAADSAGQDPRAPLLLGMAWFGLHDYADAVAPLEKASAAAPGNLELRRTLANSCLWSGNGACALAQVQAILDQSPDSAQAHVMMAEALDASDRLPEAITELQKAEQLAPREPMLHFELGYLYFKHRDLDAAAAEFHRELSENPGAALAWTYLGEIALQQNNLADAQTQLSKATQAEPSLEVAHFDLGSVYAQENRPEDAIVQFERAVAIDPSDPAAHYRLARLYRQTGQTAKADTEFSITETLHQKKHETLVDRMSAMRAADGH